MEKLLLKLGFIKISEDVYKYYIETEAKISMEYDLQGWCTYVVEDGHKMMLNRNADEDYIKDLIENVKKYE